MSAASGVSGGGVVVKNNDLWFAGRTDFDLPANGLYRVDFDCDPDIDPDCVIFHKPPYPVLPYGINIDKAQNIWIAGQFDQVIRYEPAADAWTEFRPQIDPVLAGNNIMRGMVVDDDGIAWVAVGNLQVNQGQNPRIVRLDPTADPPTVQAYGPETIKELANPVGMSIDADGFLWVVDSAANKAYRIDRAEPAKYTVIGGLVTPYTYGDMTGYALSLVVPG